MAPALPPPRIGIRHPPRRSSAAPAARTRRTPPIATGRSHGRRRTGTPGSAPREPFQLAGQIPRRLSPLPNVLLEAATERPGRGPAGLLAQRRERRRIAAQDRAHHVGLRRAGERPAAREHLVEDRPARRGPSGDPPLPRAPVRETCSRSFRESRRAWSACGGRPPRGRSGVGRPDELRETEVEHLHRAVVGDQDVRGLEIAMDDPALVCVLERLGDLRRDRGVRRRRAWVHADALVEPLARDQLHREEAHPVPGADGMEAVDRSDVRVVERSRAFRFALESGQPLRIRRERFGKHLDRHVAAEGGVVAFQTTPMPPSPIFSTTR